MIEAKMGYFQWFMIMKNQGYGTPKIVFSNGSNQ